MATLTQVFARTSFSTTPGTELFTVPIAASAAIVTNIVVTNTAATPETFTILFDGVEMFLDTEINGKSTISIDLKQPVLAPSGEVTGSASSTSVKVHMSGVYVL